MSDMQSLPTLKLFLIQFLDSHLIEGQAKWEFFLLMFKLWNFSFWGVLTSVCTFVSFRLVIVSLLLFRSYICRLQTHNCVCTEGWGQATPWLTFTPLSFPSLFPFHERISMLSFISRSGIFSEIASEMLQSDLCFSEIGCKSKHVNKEQQRFRCQAFHGDEILSKSGSKRSIIQFRHHQTEMLTIHQSNQ